MPRSPVFIGDYDGSRINCERPLTTAKTSALVTFVVQP